MRNESDQNETEFKKSPTLSDLINEYAEFWQLFRYCSSRRDRENLSYMYEFLIERAASEGLSKTQVDIEIDVVQDAMLREEADAGGLGNLIEQRFRKQDSSQSELP